MRVALFVSVLCVTPAFLMSSLPVVATEASWGEADLPPTALADRLRRFTTKRGFLNSTRAIAANRAALNSGLLTTLEVEARGGSVIRGKKTIPVILLRYKDTAKEPYPSTNLQQELFGKWPTGTMTDFYNEISYNNLNVGGDVSAWMKVKNTAAYYEGSITNGKACRGLCQGNRLGELLKEGLDEANKTIDFSKYDNDGPDGVQNSGDDNGYVDFVAFVHPGKGGECDKYETTSNNNIWSHRYSLSDLTGRDYETKNLDKTGRRIRIDDYVIMPALDCGGKDMIPIGVFTHEFGHAFGLPDLYDTARSARSQGVGVWDLMGAGSWGGDNRTPSRPSHMSAWSKDFLGWVTPTVVSTDRQAVELRRAESFPDALRVNITNDVYYLIEYRSKSGFDDSLTGPGVLVWRINDAAVRVGLINNSVNADAANPGVYLLQADGKKELDRIELRNRGDAGDPFPGDGHVVKLDNTTNPATTGKFALCNIRASGDKMLVDVRVSDGRCPP